MNVLSKSLGKVLILLILIAGIHTQPLNASKDLKGVAKIVWHVAEIYVGLTIGKKVHLKFDWQECTQGVAAVSLVFHGVVGLDKELKLHKYLQEFLK